MPRFAFVFRPISKQQIKTTHLYLESYEDEETALALIESGLCDEMKLTLREDSFGIDVYENTNYYLLSLPIPLTDSETEEIYEPGEYIIPKNVRTFSRNARSSSNSSTQADAYNILYSIHTGTRLEQVNGVSVKNDLLNYTNIYTDSDLDGNIDTIKGNLSITIADAENELQFNPLPDAAKLLVKKVSICSDLTTECSFVGKDKSLTFSGPTQIKLRP